MANRTDINDLGSIGERIRGARKSAGLSQVDLARKIGVSQPAIATWESGVHDPRRVVLAKLADALSISPEWLAAGARSSFESDPQAAAAYLRRPIRNVPVISFASAAKFADSRNVDPHEFAEDYIPVTASTPHLFAVFVDDPAVDLAFPKGSLVVIDYDDRWPGDGNFCLAVVNDTPIVRRLRRDPHLLEPYSSEDNHPSTKIDKSIQMIGCARLSIRFH